MRQVASWGYCGKAEKTAGYKYYPWNNTPSRDVMKRYQVLEYENRSGVATWQLLMEDENQLPLNTVASLPQFATIFPTVF